VVFLTISTLELLVLSFSYFAKNALRVLSKSPEDTEISIPFRTSLDYLQELNYLIEEFNNNFGFLILLTKTFSLLNIYFFVWSYLSYPNTAGVALYFIVAAVHVVRCSIIIPVLGAVYDEHLRFQKSWRECLSSLTHIEKRQLDFLVPCGFKPAQLYTIRPQTILTFFSVMTSHVIIILQIYYKN